MTVRLDIHTHVGEMFGFQEPTPEIAETVIARIKAAGLDGIAVTDHWRRDWGLALHRVVERHFPNEVIIIPGQEIDVRPAISPFDEYHCTELYLPGGRLFRTYCHPGYYTPNIVIEEGRSRDRGVQSPPRLAHSPSKSGTGGRGARPADIFGERRQRAVGDRSAKRRGRP